MVAYCLVFSYSNIFLIVGFIFVKCAYMFYSSINESVIVKLKNLITFLLELALKCQRDISSYYSSIILNSFNIPLFP